VSAAYTTINNRGDEPLRLVSAATSAAGIVEIHEMIMQNDVMQMRPIDGLDIPAGGSAVLEQGGYHIMLLELAAPLIEGSAIPLTLTFDVVNEDGSLQGMPFEVILAAPVLSEPPLADFAFSSTWARPTVTEMAMELATPEATAEMGGMGGMGAMHASSDVSAAYMTITNLGSADDVLIAASSPAAGIVEIHEVIMQNDVMQMRPVEGGIPLPAGESASLEPGGLHIMLLDLQMPLVEGTAIPITLTFESGAQLTVAAPVIDRLMMGME
ncbi:MAG TPA: copper chaperone PCu(A)C, partial [Candidatus Limnocylindrales bacterium]|nr:copper chaperone PCu(A)C [Candidatus Limnocylindrales bacterium]